jgi:lipoprotein-anchoring transpeptidase ErfK/SrfK
MRIGGIVVAAAMALTACAQPTQQAADTIIPGPGSSVPATTTTPPPRTASTSIAVSSTTAVLSTATIVEGTSLAARADHPLAVFDGPNGASVTTLAPETGLGTPRVVRVLDGPVDGWLHVALPVRPNGSTGWVRASDVMLFVLDTAVDVDLGARTLVVRSPEGVLLETTVAIGSPSNPTPTGSFFVTDSVILVDPAGPWGPHAFGLSAHSDTVTEFNGGDGIIGIHGTNQPSSIGHARSLGCIRVPNDVALELAGLISAGVPVEIH